MGQRPTGPELVTDEFGKSWWLFHSGQSVPNIFGAEDDPDDDSDDDADDKKSDDKSSDDDADDDDDGDDDKEDDKPDKLKERMRAADRRSSQLQKELDALRAKDKERSDAEKTDLERAQGRVKELEAQTAKDADTIKNLRVQLAFFSVNDVQWHDADDALSNLDLSEVEIGEDGKVNRKQLRKAIKALAESKPHWVKGENDSSSGASGSKMNGRRKGDKDAPDVDALAKDFPALKNRV